MYICGTQVLYVQAKARLNLLYTRLERSSALPDTLLQRVSEDGMHGCEESQHTYQVCT